MHAYNHDFSIWRIKYVGQGVLVHRSAAVFSCRSHMRACEVFWFWKPVHYGDLCKKLCCTISNYFLFIVYKRPTKWVSFIWFIYFFGCSFNRFHPQLLRYCLLYEYLCGGQSRLFYNCCIIYECMCLLSYICHISLSV